MIDIRPDDYIAIVGLIKNTSIMERMMHSSESRHFGAELAEWAWGLDHANERINWWILRTASVLEDARSTLPLLHGSFLQLRR